MRRQPVVDKVWYLLPVIALMASGCVYVPGWQGNLSALDFELDPNTYIVRAGENGRSIAYRYRITEAELQRLNPGINLYALVPGDMVIIRPRGVAAQAQQRYPGRAPAAEYNTGATGAYAAQDRFAVTEVSGPRRLERQARSYPTRPGGQPVRTGSALSDDAYLVYEEDYAQDLPPLEQGVFTEQGLPQEEILDNNYVIAGTLGDPQLAAALPSDPVGAAVGTVVGAWTWPTDGQVTRDFNPRRPNGTGIDIAGTIGQDVVAVSDGVVEFTGTDPTNVGQVIMVKHADGFLSVYSHVKDLYVKIGERVKAGDPIASLGPNPADESMLRFELRRDRQAVDPMRVLPL